MSRLFQFITIGILWCPFLQTMAVPADSADVPCQWPKAEKHLSRFQFQKALPVLQSCFRKADTNQGLIQRKLALSYYKLGQYQSARRHYRQLLKKDSTSIQVLNRLALVNLNTGQYTSARAYYHQLIQIDSTNSYYYNQLGNLAERKGQQEKAYRYYQKVLRLNPKNLEALSQISALLLAEKQLSEANKWVKQGVGLDSSHLGLQKLRAKIAYQQKHYEKVVSATRQVMKHQDTTKLILKLAGVSHLQLGHLEQAIHFLENGIGRPGQSELMHYYLGLAYRKNEKIDKSKQHLKRAIEIGKSPNLGLFYQQLAHTYESQDAHPAAIKAFRKAYRESGHKTLLYHLARTYDEYYQDEKPAINYYQKYLAEHDTSHAELMQYARQRVDKLKRVRHFRMDSLAKK